jgi:hypothetical protein
MIIKKLEWRSDFRQLNPDPLPAETPPQLSRLQKQFVGSDEWIEYKKGEVINVEVMGDGRFRDVDKDRYFQTDDERHYRI